MIRLENVSKKFRVPSEKRCTLFEEIVSFITGKRGYVEFWVLKNVNLSIRKGEVVGITGPNGSGKSTLLKIIAGVIYPDEGRVEVLGKITPILELGIGFNPELTALENVRLYGALIGMSRKDIERKIEEIFGFAELEKFRNMKLKNYSSGMYARLAFATAIATEPEILLIDEVLAVGDTSFQKKCIAKIKELKNNGTTMVVVSHSIDLLKEVCDKIYLLRDGRIYSESS